MRNPLIEIPFYQGIKEAKDYSNGDYISPTIGGTVGLKLTDKGYAAFSNINGNNYKYSKTLNGTYSIVAFVKTSDIVTTRSFIDFRESSGSGNISYNANAFNISSGTCYVDNVQTNIAIANKYQCLVVNNFTISSTILYLLTSYLGINPIKGFMTYFAIYSGSLNELERNEIQAKFNNLALPQSSITLSEVRPIPNFDLNIAITVADNDSLDFGTGSFSIYWEDSYPQRQTATNSTIIRKNNSLDLDGFLIIHTGINTNQIQVIERSSIGPTSITVLTGIVIPNGNHKFLLVRSTIDNKYHLFIDGVETNTSGVLTFLNLNTTATLNIKNGIEGVNRTSGNFKNLKIWKGQAVTWAQATQGFKTGLVLDLPLDEGTGTTVFDRSGLGNNGTITASAAYANKEWVVKQFDKGIIKYDFKDLNCDGNSVLPKGWIKSAAGTFKGVLNTVKSGILEKDTKYLECTSALAVVAFPSNKVYGTWKEIMHKVAASSVSWYFIRNTINPTPRTGYIIRFSFDNKIRLIKIINDVETTLIETPAIYFSNIYYEIKVTRSIIGLFNVYVNNNIIGTVTDNSITSSNFNVNALESGARITNCSWNSQII